jgi:hypothetical protein
VHDILAPRTPSVGGGAPIARAGTLIKQDPRRRASGGRRGVVAYTVRQCAVEKGITVSKRAYALMVVLMVSSGLVGAAVAAWLVGGRAVGAQPAGVTASSVTASEFRLVDGAGRQRAALGVTPDGTVALNLSDPDQRPRAFLAVRADGSATVSLHDRGGTSRFNLNLSADGAPVLNLNDAAGAARFILALSTPENEGYPFIAFRDAKEQGTRLFLGQRDNGAPTVVMWDEARVARLLLYLFGDGTPRLNLHDPNGTPRQAVGMFRSGEPAINLWDAVLGLLWDAPPTTGELPRPEPPPRP